MSDIPPGGREKDNRKQKLAEKEKIVDRAIWRDLPRTAVLCRGNFLFSEFLGEALGWLNRFRARFPVCRAEQANQTLFNQRSSVSMQA